MAGLIVKLAKFVAKKNIDIEESVSLFFNKNKKYTVDVNLINITIKNIVHLDSSEEKPEQIQLHYRLYISVIKTTIERIESDDKHKIHFNKLINHLSENLHCEIWLLKVLNIVKGHNITIDPEYDNCKFVNLNTIICNYSSSKKLHNIICRYLSIISLSDLFDCKIGIFTKNIFDIYYTNKLSSTQILKIFAHIFTIFYNNIDTNIRLTNNIVCELFICTFRPLIDIMILSELKKREVCKNSIYLDTLEHIYEILINIDNKLDIHEKINNDIARIIIRTIEIAQYYNVVFDTCKDTYTQYQDLVSSLFTLIKFDFNTDINLSPDMFECYRQVLQFLIQDEKQQQIPHVKIVNVLQVSMNYKCDEILVCLIDYYLTFELSDKFCIYMNNRLAKTDDISLGVKYITKLLESNMKYWERCDNFYKVANYVRRNLSSHTYLHDIYKILLINFNKYKTNRKYLADILYIMSKYIHTTSPFSVKELQVFKQNLPFIKHTIISYSENTPKEILYKYHLKKQYKYLSKKANIMYWKKMSNDLLRYHH